jgi:phosphoglycerate kinase
MTSFKTLDDLGDVTGKRALVRVDLNVPMADGEVTDDTRLRATLPTVTELADRGAVVLLLAHFGRPKGEKRPDMSQSLVTRAYEQVLGRPVRYIGETVGPLAAENVAAMQPGDVGILENTRFHAGEEKNDPELARAMAELGDIYVNDAFSAAHRAHSSTEGIARLLPAYAGARWSGAEGAAKGAGRAGASGRGCRRRGEGLEQARRAPQPRRQGRSPDHRRRHGQHFPGRARRRCRQIALRA